MDRRLDLASRLLRLLYQRPHDLRYSTLSWRRMHLLLNLASWIADMVVMTTGWSTSRTNNPDWVSADVAAFVLQTTQLLSGT